jgi:hypothetical protein
MSTSTRRSGGTAALLAAVALVLSAILAVLLPPEGIVDSASEYVYRGLAIVAYGAIIAAVLGLHQAHRGIPRYGGLGTIGTVATVVGYGVMLVLSAIVVVRDFEYLLTIRVTAAFVLLIGSVLLGIAVLRARLLPWWCGVLLIAAFPLGDLANALFPVAENLLLALLWGSVGLALRQRRPVSAEPMVATPSAPMEGRGR